MKFLFAPRRRTMSGWLGWLPVLFLIPAFLLALTVNLGHWQSLSAVEETLRQPHMSEESLLTNLAGALRRIHADLQERFARGQGVQQLMVWTRETRRQAMMLDHASQLPLLSSLESLLHILSTTQPLKQDEMVKAEKELALLLDRLEELRKGNHSKSHEILTAWLAQEKILRTSLLWSMGGIALLTLAALLTLVSHRRLEDALRENQQTLATLLGNLPGMAYRCRNDKQWTMVFVSQGCEALTGYPATSLLGNTAICFNDLIDPRDQQRIWREVQQSLAENRPFQLTYRIITAHGREKWVWEQGARRPDSRPGAEFLEGFITDITATIQCQEGLRQATAQAEANNRRRGDALLLLSHKVRTPLTALNGGLALMAGVSMDGQLAHYHALARGAADRLSHVVEDLLDLAMGEGLTALRLFQPHTILKQVLDFVTPEARHRELSLRLEIDPAVAPWLRGNVPCLRQLLLQLVSNAVQMAETGEILLAVRPLAAAHSPLSLAFTLSFDGEMAPWQQSGASFLQETPTQRLVHELQAQLTTSYHPPRSQYLLVVPLELSPAIPLAPHGEEGAELPSLHLLLAEDDPSLQEVISELLEMQGHQVAVVGNGLELLEQVEQGRFDLILMDLRMPRLNGYQAAQRLRASSNSEVAGLPIVALTADLADQSLRRCLEAGINAVEGKPIHLASLTRTMARVLGQRQFQCPAPARQPVHEPRDLDDETFLRLRESLGQARFLEVAQLMAANAAELLARLQQALHGGDGLDGTAAAHRLAGAAGNLGMERVARGGKALEAAFAAGQWEEVAALLAALSTDVDKATAQLLQRLAQ